LKNLRRHRFTRSSTQTANSAARETGLRRLLRSVGMETNQKNENQGSRNWAEQKPKRKRKHKKK
jgi:hypothetical protein